MNHSLDRSLTSPCTILGESLNVLWRNRFRVSFRARSLSSLSVVVHRACVRESVASSTLPPVFQTTLSVHPTPNSRTGILYTSFEPGNFGSLGALDHSFRYGFKFFYISPFFPFPTTFHVQYTVLNCELIRMNRLYCVRQNGWLGRCTWI